MSMDLTGIINKNEYYTDHYFSSVFEDNASETISKWRTEAKESEDVRTPWALLRDAARQYYPIHDRFVLSKFDTQTLANIRTLADIYLKILGYPDAAPEWVEIDDTIRVPVYVELKKPNGAPALWVMLAASDDKEASVLEKNCFSAAEIGEEGLNAVSADSLTAVPNENLVNKIFFEHAEPPRFIILIGMNQIALIDRNKWSDKRFLLFDIEEIFSRHEETTLQAMAVLLHRSSLCPEEGTVLLDELDANSQKHANGVSQDLKYALRECIELLGNEVLYDMSHRQGRDLDADPVDAGQLTLECLRYMYRMLFVLFIEARSELGYAPIKAQAYLSGYSLESLRDIAENIRDDVAEVGGGYYMHETLSKLYDLIYNGYPATEEEVLKYSQEEGLHDMFVIAPLKAHIFDPEYTKMISGAKLRNSVMLRIIDLMSLTRESGRKNSRRGRISYKNLGINQMGSVYEALLSYRGFIAEHTLFEVKRAGDSFNELDVGYFVPEEELGNYTEEERVRYEKDDPDGRYKKGQLRKHEKGTFIYRLAGREREKSASYYTPEVLTKCLVKYALKELLEGKTADEILHLTVCEPAMGSAAFLNEAINQIAEAYLDRKQRELGELIPAEQRLPELQKVKMFIADNNVYGIDLNPVAVELAEVSLWLNTIYQGGYVPWFGTQLVNGNSLIGARRQVYHKSQLTATSKGLRWFESAPERIPFVRLDANGRNIARSRYQVYHFLTGDPGMCNYTDKVIKSLEPDKIKMMKEWNKRFTASYTEDEFKSLIELSKLVDVLWKEQIKARRDLEAATITALDVYGRKDTRADSHRTIREKDKLLRGTYKSEHARNAGAYARLKFAMDYWCALWFWPISQADLLPKRSDFIFEMDLILRGTMQTNAVNKQTNLFETEDEDDVLIQEVNLDQLCNLFPRLALVREIAQQNHFMHWELEFADLFAERGGFDLVVGNPPWIALKWNEIDVISDMDPRVAIKKYSASQINSERQEMLCTTERMGLYLSEYSETSGTQSYLNAVQNYSILSGMKTNLYKCFIPLSWYIGNNNAVMSFLHPEGTYDDPKGGVFRANMYPKLKRHYQFVNEKLLFKEISDTSIYSINIYCNKASTSFEQISSLYDPITIDRSYEDEGQKPVPEIKDEYGNWNISGHKDRIVQITKADLKVLARLFDDEKRPNETRMPSIYSKDLMDILERLAVQERRLGDLNDAVYMTQFLDETACQKNGIIEPVTGFSEDFRGLVYAGPYIGIGNPLYKTPRQVKAEKADYDRVDLVYIDDCYYQRSIYRVNPLSDYDDPKTPWGSSYTSEFRYVVRRRLGLNQERTLMGAIIPPGPSHINGVFGMCFKDLKILAYVSSLLESLPYDYFVRALGKGDIYNDTAGKFPLPSGIYQKELIGRTMLLNCVNKYYRALWDKILPELPVGGQWAKADPRLDNAYYEFAKWSPDAFVRTDYARRELLVEIDVLVAMSLGMTLRELQNLYCLQFPVHKKYEDDTWYDANGRIVFTINKGIPGVGFSRPEWENGIKDAPIGQKFYRTITDDTMPGGPVERTIEYVAPFDRCDREQDYETAWKFFEEKYGEK